MNTEQVLSSVVSSLVTPIIVSLAVKRNWPSKVKFLVSVGVTTLLTLIFSLGATNLQFEFQYIRDQLLLTLFLVETNYRLWFKESIIECYIRDVVGDTKPDVAPHIKEDLVEPKIELSGAKPQIYKEQIQDFGTAKTYVNAYENDNGDNSAKE